MLCSDEHMWFGLGPGIVCFRLAMYDSIFRKTNESKSGGGHGAQQGFPSGFMQQSEQVSVIWSAELACVVCAGPGSISNTGIVRRGKQTLPTKSVGEAI